MANSIKIDLGINTRETERAIKNLNSTLDSLTRTTSKLNTSLNGIQSAKVSESLGKIETSYNKVAKSNEMLIEQNKKTENSFNGLALSAASLAVPVGVDLVKNFNTYGASAKAVATTTQLVTEKLKGAVTAGSQVGQTTRQLGVAVGQFSKTFFGLIDTLALAGVGFIALGRNLEQSENGFKRLSGTMLIVIGVISGGLAYAVTKAISYFGNLAFKIGSDLSSSFEMMAQKFAKTERTTIVFGKTIENFSKVTDVAIGTTASWTAQVAKISGAFNFSTSAVQKAGQEIIAVTSQMGFNQDQMEKLLKISAEYAAFNQKDLFQTTVNMVAALNGNAQAVQALGIKLNETALQQFLFAQGSTENFRSLSEAEKVQTRYNKLLKSYKQVAGLGAAAAATLAGQNDRLKVNMENLNSALGRGAALIENNNLGAAALNLVLDNVNETVIASAGFLGALGARIAQVAGLFLKWSFVIFSVKKAITLLNIVLSGDLTQSLFRMPIGHIIKQFLHFIPVLNLLTPGVDKLAKSFTFLNSSMIDVLKNSGAGFVNLSTTGNVVKTVISSLYAQMKNLLGIILGVNGATLTLSSILQGAVLRSITIVKFAAIGLGKVLAVLFSPITLTIGAVIGAFLLVKSVLEEIEKRTGAFTTVFNILKQAFLEGATIFEPVVNLFNKMKEFVMDLASVAFGFLIAQVAKASSLFLNLIKLNPFGVFSEEQLAKVDSASKRLNDLSSNLNMVAFDVRKLKEETERAIAGTNDAFKAVNTEELAKLREEYKDFGKSQVTILEEAFRKRTELVNNALSQNLITEQQHKELVLNLQKDFETKRIDAIREANEKERELAEKRRNEQLNQAFMRSQEKINFILQDFEQEKIIQDELEQQRRDREAIISNEAFQRLQANLGRERALKEVEAAQDLARAGKTSEALKRIRAAQVEADKNSLKSLFDFEKNTNAGRAANFKSTLGTISTLSQQNNSTLFNIGKAAAVSQATIDGIAAVQKALASAPPPFNFALAALVGVATGANIAKIASAKPPQKFADGGFVGGNSFSGDRVPILANSGEFVANRAQQQNILQAVANGSFSDAENNVAGEIKLLREDLLRQPINVMVNGRVFAVALRDEIKQNNFRLA